MGRAPCGALFRPLLRATSRPRLSPGCTASTRCSCRERLPVRYPVCIRCASGRETFAHPFNTGCLPLNCHCNPGVNSPYRRGAPLSHPRIRSASLNAGFTCSTHQTQGGQLQPGIINTGSISYGMQTIIVEGTGFHRSRLRDEVVLHVIQPYRERSQAPLPMRYTIYTQCALLHRGVSGNGRSPKTVEAEPKNFMRKGGTMHRYLHAQQRKCTTYPCRKRYPSHTQTPPCKVRHTHHAYIQRVPRHEGCVHVWETPPHQSRAELLETQLEISRLHRG